MAANERRLAGRVAIVTGASRGIGEAIARGFAAEGASVAVAARTEQVWNERLPGTIYEVAEQINAAGGRAIAVRCDVGRPEDLEQLVDVVHDELGPVDVLVNNATLTAPGRPPAPAGSVSGGSTTAALAPSTTAPAAEPARPRPPGISEDRLSFLNFPVKGYRLHFEIGVFGAYRLMQLVLPDMIERGQGSIVNISSGAAFVPGEGPYGDRAGRISNFAYGGNKAALQHLTQAVAQEMATYGIAVNALLPSLAVRTPGLTATSGGREMAEISMESFVEATIRLAVTSPEETSGIVAWSEDVLHPELGRRGWLGE